ncbi:hypothetical protein OPIT5_00040 (plasmid) [Opitutaceae bacterium TAV5]|nr:hypothetical protein OPIT5_00040 [Opitutaceae bacterium TAV5]
MKRRLIFFPCLLLGGLVPVSGGGDNMFRVPLPAEQARPFAVMCSPDDSVLVTLPYPATGWSGRGFMPQGVSVPDGGNAGAAGDFSVFPGDLRGYTRFTISALVDSSNRTLHVFMEGGRSLSIECTIVPREQAFRGVTFVDNVAVSEMTNEAIRSERQRKMKVERSENPPVSNYQAPTPETQLGIKNFMKALLAMNRERALNMVRANPALQIVPLQEENDSGDYTISLRYAIRDSITDTLGVAAVVRNNTYRRLQFDPKSWIIRAGNRVYPVPTAEFDPVIEPEKEATAFLVLSRDTSGMPTRLLPDSPLKLSVSLVGKTNPKPIMMEPANVE